jgi:hypothetical protein
MILENDFEKHPFAMKIFPKYVCYLNLFYCTVIEKRYGKPESYANKKSLADSRKKVPDPVLNNRKGYIHTIRIRVNTETVRLDSNPGSAPGLASTLSAKCVFVSQEAGGSLGSPLNLQESLLEFSQLQDRIKKEQELLLDSRLSIDIQAFGSSNAEAATTAAPFRPGRPEQLFATAAPAAAAAVFESSGSSNMRGLKISAQLTTAPPSSTVASRISPPPPPTTTFSGGFKQPASRLAPPLPAYTQLRTPDSSSLMIGSSSPFSIKLEPGTTTAADSLRETTAAAAAPARSSNNNECSSSSSNSNSSGHHAILKQFLQDTSFQSKFNLKPFDLGGGLSGFVTAGAGGEKSAGLEENSSSVSGGLLEVKIEPVLDLAVQQVQKDIDTTCEMLSISKGTSTCGSCIYQICIKTPKPKCRLYWCLLEFIDWR